MRKTVRDLYLLIGLAGATAGLVVAQNTEEPARPPAQEPARPPADEPAQPASEDAEGPGTDVDDVFIPTEEVLADEEITFPVDI
jgi:hypothetical protein